MCPHIFHVWKILVAFITIIWQIFTMNNLFMIHHLFFFRKFFITNIATNFFKKTHFYPNSAFFLSQQFLQSWPSIFQFPFALYLINPIFPLHNAQKFFFFAWSFSFLSKHSLHNKPSMSHCHRGYHKFVIFLVIPHSTLGCIIFPSKYSFDLSKWQSPQSRPLIPHSLFGLCLWVSCLLQTAQNTGFLLNSLIISMRFQII